MRALIVDDSSTMRSVLRMILRASGIETAEAGNGAEALRRLEETGAVDFALVDWNMPVMNGFDMLVQLRAQGFSDLKVMMVTTEAENDFIVRALDAGADEYLMKPFDEEGLSEKLALMGLAEA